MQPCTIWSRRTLLNLPDSAAQDSFRSSYLLTIIIITVSLIILVTVSRPSPNLWTAIVGKLPKAAAVDEQPAGLGFHVRPSC